MAGVTPALLVGVACVVVTSGVVVVGPMVVVVSTITGVRSRMLLLVVSGWSTTPVGSPSSPLVVAATMPAADTISVATHAATSALRGWAEPTAAAAEARSRCS